MPWKVPFRALSRDPDGAGLSKVTVVPVPDVEDGLEIVNVFDVDEPTLMLPKLMDVGLTERVGD